MLMTDMSLPFSILYRSSRLLVIDKPVGLPVHPGPKAQHSVESFFPLLSRRRNGPWLAHRLDTETSGCLLIALRKQSLIEAQEAFRSGLVHKTYWAVVQGCPDAPSGVIEKPLRKVTSPSGWYMEPHRDGLTARTVWRVLSFNQGRALLELILETGRTHQARVHCAMLGCPIIGDRRYGGPDGVLHLMSRSLGLTLGMDRISVCAAPPRHMIATAQSSGLDFL